MQRRDQNHGVTPTEGDDGLDLPDEPSPPIAESDGRPPQTKDGLLPGRHEQDGTKEQKTE